MRFQQLSDIYDEELTEIEDLIRSGNMDPLRVKTLESLKDTVVREQDQLDSIKRSKKVKRISLRRIPGWKESIYWSENVRKEIEEFKKKWG